jgi:hypothetical protein
MTNVVNVNVTSHAGNKHDPLNILRALTYMEAQTPHYQRSDYLETRRLGDWGRGSQCSHWNEIWRTRIIEFFYRFIDNHPANLSREVVFLSSSIADRYLTKLTIDAEFDQEQSKSFYQLVALTSLYLGIKAYRHRFAVAARLPEIAAQEEFLREDNDVVTIQSLLRSSTSGIQADDVRAMTRSILTTLSWQIRPISPLLFAKYIVGAISTASTRSISAVTSGMKRRRHPTSNCSVGSTLANGADRSTTTSSDDTRRQQLHSEMYDRSRFLCELSVCDYYFITYASSSVALASVFVAIDQMNLSNQEMQNYDELLQNVLSWTRMDQHLTEIVHLKKRLDQIYERSSETNSQHNRPPLIAEVDVVEENDDDDTDRAYLEEETQRKFRRVISSEDLLSLSTLNKTSL